MAVNTKMPLTNTADGYLCEGTDIRGGYFVIDKTENIPSTITKTGSLCYCITESKFYQYDGVNWIEKEFGTTTQATASSLGLVKIGYTESDKNYPVELNNEGQMYVNVPWTDTDTNTWRPIGTGAEDAAAGDHTHNYAGSSSIGGGASTVAITDTTPTSETAYYPIYSTNVSGDQVARANKDLYYYDSGTWSSLNIGSSSNAGILTLHQNNGKCGDLQVAAGLTTNRTYTFPDKTGTVALLDDVTVTKVADLTGNIAATDLVSKLKGTTSTTLALGNHTHNYAPSSHTHNTSDITDLDYETFSIAIKNSTGTNVSALAHDSTYTLAAGGATYSFKTPTDADTKNTAGSENKSSTKLYLVGTTSQDSTGITSYSNSKVFINSSNSLEAPAFYATSDKRLKQNIIDYRCDKSILDLPIKKYEFISNPGKTYIGCIAQDLQEICPEIVNTNEDGYLSISESKIIYLLLDEVKKLKSELDNRIAAIEEQLNK